MEVRKVRDLSLITLDESKTMVIACDSTGSIGMKDGDVLKVPPFYVGRFAARVVLLEVLCSGAEVVTIADAVCNEMNPTGEEIIMGIRAELTAANISEIVLTGSTEENFATNSTGVGITAVGIGSTKRLKINNIKQEAVIISIGIPKVGAEINFKEDNEIIDYKTIYELLNNDLVYEIVPVGSKGIEYEASVLAENNNLKLYLEKVQCIDIKKSGGPATSVIAAVDAKAADNLLSTVPEANIIGYLKNIN
jgi:hypothetical protein